MKELIDPAIKMALALMLVTQLDTTGREMLINSNAVAGIVCILLCLWAIWDIATIRDEPETQELLYDVTVYEGAGRNDYRSSELAKLFPQNRG